MGILDSIKSDAKKSGGNKAKFMYFREAANPFSAGYGRRNGDYIPRFV